MANPHTHETDAKLSFGSLRPNLTLQQDGRIEGPRKDSDEYLMNHSRRGLAIIFNHEKFKNANKNRAGSDQDVKALQGQFGRMGFDVKTYHDLKKDEIFKVLKEVANDNSDKAKDVDCLIIVVMTHGSSNELAAHDETYRSDKLWAAFSADKCPALVAKPKLFFIQACRGTQVDQGVRVRPVVQTDAIAVSYTIPTWADVIIANATFDGYYAWRSPDQGSWFIQSLCRELEECSETKEICQILTRVNRRVAINYVSCTVDKAMDQKKQMPNFLSTLTRELYFRPKQSRENLV